MYIISAMLRPEKEDPDLQLSLSSDKSDDKPQIHHTFMPKGPVLKDSTEYCPSETLFMIRIQLKRVPPNILTNRTLKHLYLEGNQISSLPESLFTSLPRLLWLDLRNNKITSLPAEIGLHRCLRTLLLEGNLISALPRELGNVMSLKALNLRYCPIVFPPRDVLQQGLQAILQYLRAAIAEGPVSVRASLPELPEVEKLQLSELVGSSTEELADEDELQRFRELKRKIILLDRTELGPSPAKEYTNPKCHFLPIIKRAGNSVDKKLEGNQISSLPESLFTSLPRLLWLDLRNNKITSLPAKIGLHRCLRTLLLEGNLISALPRELGNVMSLKALNLRYCPIVFPPRDVLQQGLQAILQYLRAAIAEGPVSVRASLPELPEVEKLQLSELVGSSTEELADEDELQRFRELKRKIILLDRTELGPSPAKEYTNPKCHFLPIIKRKTETTKASIMPPLPLSDTQHQKKPDEWRHSATKAIEKFKVKEALQQWCRNAQKTEGLQMQVWRQKHHEKQRSQKEAESKAHPADSKIVPALMCISCESKCLGFR
ncbi:LOW QUALITY PROTEIN: leucine-rich repeat-containing protein 40-like [Thalassophryne amazonica]|uniref:LOW QUALITY PROTEIN: leucine-rich repeat-containing protein 40-like n=1 Tax=Thalassophryne amazonica TaxID=390379 RepID=UPI0014725501|nr:LOW QUALITY PROTEIN: leucine-rich repeat-containing protein 40-like [Thalassophryne amazonica]